MKKRIVLLIALCMFFTTVLGFTGFSSNNAIAATAFQRVNNVSAVVTVEALNVRQGAGTNYPVVCVLKKGQTVKVFGKLGNWYAIYDPMGGCVGAVDSAYLKPAGTVPTPTKAPVPAPTTKPGTGGSLPAPVGTPMPAPAGITADEQKCLTLINQHRTKAGLSPLMFDMGLEKVARVKAKDMVDNNYFSHQSPTYGSPFDMMRQFGVTFRTAGENIAGNQTIEGAVTAWMNSPGHKANILNGNYNYTGIGICKGGPYGNMMVQQFIGK